MTASTIPLGAQVLIDGFLYTRGEVPRAAIGANRLGELPALLTEHPGIKVSVNTEQPDSLQRFVRCLRPDSGDVELETRRTTEHGYKLEVLCSDQDVVHLDAEAFAAAVEAQRKQLLEMPGATPQLKDWVRAAAAGVLARFGGSPRWVLQGRLLPYPRLNADGQLVWPKNKAEAEATVAALLQLNPATVEG